MIVHDSAFVTLDIIESKHLLLSKWKQICLSTASFKQELILCRNFCASFSVKRIIMNQEQFSYVIPSDLFTWIENEFNLAISKLGVQDLAFVLAQDSQTQVSIINFFDKADSIFNPKFFANQQQAIDWITGTKKDQLRIISTRPAETFDPAIDINMNTDKSKVIIKLEFPIDSLSQSLQGLKHHLNKMSFMRAHWPQFSSLTKREEDLLKLVVKGFKNHEIADALCIAANTVKTHRRNIIKKLDAKNLIDLYRYAECFDLI